MPYIHCKNCIFCQNDSDLAGECRRHSPTADSRAGEPLWPLVDKRSMGCGDGEVADDFAPTLAPNTFCAYCRNNPCTCSHGSCPRCKLPRKTCTCEPF